MVKRTLWVLGNFVLYSVYYNFERPGVRNSIIRGGASVMTGWLHLLGMVHLAVGGQSDKFMTRLLLDNAWQ